MLIIRGSNTDQRLVSPTPPNLLRLAYPVNRKAAPGGAKAPIISRPGGRPGHFPTRIPTGPATGTGRLAIDYRQRSHPTSTMPRAQCNDPRSNRTWTHTRNAFVACLLCWAIPAAVSAEGVTTAAGDVVGKLGNVAAEK